MTSDIKVLIRIRRDVTENWRAKNPVLSSCELGADTTLKKLKIGDGVTTWEKLPYHEVDEELFEKLTEGFYVLKK